MPELPEVALCAWSAANRLCKNACRLLEEDGVVEVALDDPLDDPLAAPLVAALLVDVPLEPEAPVTPIWDSASSAAFCAPSVCENPDAAPVDPPLDAVPLVWLVPTIGYRFEFENIMLRGVMSCWAPRIDAIFPEQDLGQHAPASSAAVRRNEPPFCEQSLPEAPFRRSSGRLGVGRHRPADLCTGGGKRLPFADHRLPHVGDSGRGIEAATVVSSELGIHSNEGLMIRRTPSHHDSLPVVRAFLAFRIALLAALVLVPLGAFAQLRPDAPTVLITGANRGIGLELARQYAASGWNVIATSRHAAGDPALAALQAIAASHPQVVLERIDVTDTAMIRAVAQKYRDQPIDVLINNAAAVNDTFAADMATSNIPYDKIDYDAARHDFDVNTLGPMRMVEAFAPNVERSHQKKIATITSLAGSFTRGLPGAMAMNYSASKAALNKYMVMLAFAMKPRGVLVGLFEPIFVASKRDMNARMRAAAPIDREVGKLIRQIAAMSPETSGKIVNFTTGKIDPF